MFRCFRLVVLSIVSLFLLGGCALDRFYKQSNADYYNPPGCTITHVYAPEFHFDGRFGSPNVGNGYTNYGHGGNYSGHGPNRCD